MDWRLEVVMVPVTDIDRAKRFYRDQVGFVVDHDTTIGNTRRFVQLTPPGSSCSIVVGNLTPTGIPFDSRPGSAQGLQLVVADIEAARETLMTRGVQVSEVHHVEDGDMVPGKGGDWNAFCAFTDPDGNGWALQESPNK